MSNQENSSQENNVTEALAGLDSAKRDTLLRLLKGGAIAAPVVASFAMQGLAIKPARAQPASSVIFSNT